ncbi:hypothetical protein Zmor_007838 [Zophobas morio]|uniref:Odorant receptor n=1 Tax=Zophobas morio TaxID=2755281 RepID=A0AA38MP59_9CUCU|nr:hypothetical protein Zmor_007838 [Zophobas morio]
MEKYDWKINIKINILLLRIMGLWPSSGTSNKFDFYIFYTFILVSLFIIGHISFQVVNIYFIRDNLEALAGTSYILLVELLGACKAYLLLRNMTLLKRLLTLLNSDLFQPRNEHQRILIEPSIRFWRTIYNVFLVMCFGSNAFWAVFPFLDRIPGHRRLPFLAWYPYNAQMSPYYEITYVYQIISISYLTLVHVNVDTLVSAFNVYTGCQFDLLKDSLIKIGDDSKTCRVDNNVTRCIEHHKEILNFVDNCNQFFNWILFLQFFISGVSIGITMFQLTLVVPFSNEFYSLLSYGVAIIVEIFMYCWFGNEVQVKSDTLSYAAFECDWTDLPQDIKRKLLFFTMNLLQPVRPSALNLFYLSLDTFMKILKTAWSYFTLLHQMNS